jgi:hypothetical protein
VLTIFGITLARSMKWADRHFGPKLYQLETNGPS